MKKYTSKAKGFTIVELLIVIVVIAILAAVTIVAYNGIQAKAKAAAVESQVDKYRKALMQYATINRDYPRTTESFCLGEASNYPSGCYAGTTTDVATETKLRSVMSTLPKVDTSCKVMGAETCRRNMPFIYQSNATVNGVSSPYSIMYFLDDAQNCKLSGTLGGTWENYSTTLNGTGYFEQDSSSKVTMCVLQMPDPAKL